MHILIIPSWYKSITEPVLGTFFEEQARALMSAGHKVGIIYPQFSSVSSMFNKKDEIIDFYDDNGLPTYSVIHQAIIPKMRKLAYKMFSENVEKIYYNYVKKYGKPDLIHAHSVFHGGMAGYYIAKDNNLPFIITEHLTAYITGGITHQEDIETAKQIFNNADASIIVSENFKHDIEKVLNLPETTFTVVHNMVADLFFKDLIIKKFNQQEEFVFFTNSFLLPRKNHKLLLDSIKYITAKGINNIRLRIGGDGPLYNELKDYVNELALTDKVDFLGALSRAEVKRELDHCHSFVLSSNYETFGVVLIESLACGRPIVTTDSGGPSDFIHSKNGITSLASIDNLANAMIKMMEEYNTFDQHKLSEECRSRFAEKKIEAEIEALYLKAIDKHK
ncbi:MAG: glycosyltransferase [Bacteroidia bacterium]|nr:glycosyltransferase [Bacteroidia bacterium]MCC7515288.1 glycosyltransferase [Bacteroidia bacterium]HMX96792.1 glycosyltransferase [Bacteroidia bacterium]HMY13098.1 glycosyltransferase [Bacteroidia bacterium]HMY63745.1 glycosyltransferase [Bacteroidia bacterium]